MNRNRQHWIATCIALVACAAAIAPAMGAGLLVADGGFGGAMEIVSHDVRVTINNGVAVTEIEQVFRNTEQRQVEALYTFPVPRGASVSNFNMWINGKEMIGEVVEKQRARQIYDSYKQKRRDPGLLEQVDYRTFEMRIFPISAAAEQRVRLTYSQELKPDGTWATYVYPLATSTRKDVNAAVVGRFSMTMRINSEIPITDIESSSHPKAFAVARHTEHFAEASMETTGGDLGRDVVVAYQVKRPHTGIDIITSKQGREDGYFLLTLTAGEELAKAAAPMDYVFVLDISGSMQNDGKLAASIDAVRAFVNALGDGERFEVMTFNVQPAMLFSQLSPVNDESKRKAADFLTTRQAQGGTSLKPALTAAYRYAQGNADRQTNIVILSDGMTEQDERAQLIQLITQRPEGVRVFCIGVGNDVNRPLLDQLAERTGGLAAFISRGDDFARQAQAFRRKLMHPAASDVKLTFEGGDVYDVEPAQLPNLYYGAPMTVYGRYRNAGDAPVLLTATVNGQRIEQRVALNLPDQNADNPQIERMWAWKRIDALLKQADGEGSRQSVIPQVVTLGEGYSIATEYTSFIVLENDAEYQRWNIERKNALRVERDRAASEKLAGQLDRLRDKAVEAIGPVPAEAAHKEVADARPVLRQITQAQPVVQPQNTQRSNGVDLDFGGGGSGGGGAIDPLTLGLAVGAIGVAGWLKKRKNTGDRGTQSRDHGQDSE
ncbi:MAG: VIT and vWA domain-containing protein [Phycisphaerales bacterium]